MIKLVPAKCPSCGANLQVDDNLKRTECEFCKTTIIVDEAIQKYAVEIKGKVKVSGIQDEDDEISIINKYIKINNYEIAQKRINKLLEKNPFNLEAIKLFLELPDLIFKQNFKFKNGIMDLKVDDYQIFETYVDVDKYLRYADALKKLDEQSNYSDFIERIALVINHITEIKNEYNNKIKREKDIVKELINKSNILIKKCMPYEKKFNELMEILDIDITKYDGTEYAKNQINEKGLYNYLKSGTGQISVFGISKYTISIKQGEYVYFFKTKLKTNLEERLNKVMALNEKIDSENKSFFGNLFRRNKE